jgi:hypothetical protein
MPVHEVFVHHFRLPRRGEEMAHFYSKSAQPLAAAGLSVYCSIRPTQS